MNEYSLAKVQLSLFHPRFFLFYLLSSSISRVDIIPLQPIIDEKMNKMIFILATALVIAGCRQQGAEEEAPASGFETMTVSKQDITLEQSYPAQIEGRQSVKIIPRVEGYLQQICVKEGHVFSKRY